MIDSVRTKIGTHDVLLITLDTLRYDVAVDCWASHRTPHLRRRLPSTGWEHRHSPGSFTFAAHTAIFAGFFPTPAKPGKHPRPFAVSFPGSETATEQTYLFDTPDIVTGFAQIGYRTVCIGGVGFFNKLSPLGNVLPRLFQESHWRPELGVTELRSTEHQVRQLIASAQAVSTGQKLFAFLNVSALHQPNCHYIAGANSDTIHTHAAALEYVDKQLATLWQFFESRGPTLVFVMSDHGTAYGEDGFTGHRLAHRTVWDVPYAEFELGSEP
jgi:Sulfatase